jgi:hypothetical protein
VVTAEPKTLLNALSGQISAARASPKQPIVPGAVDFREVKVIQDAHKARTDSEKENGDTTDTSPPDKEMTIDTDPLLGSDDIK